MKTLLKFIVCVFAGIIAASTVCKAQSPHAKHVIDSLKITDADEIKICTLYDDVITEYIKDMRDISAKNHQITSEQAAEIGKKFQQREKEIKPQIESFQKRVSGNYQQAMNFAQFCSYEAMRIVGVTSQYQKGMYKNYPVPANH